MAWMTQSEFRLIYVTESATEILPVQIGQCLDEGLTLISDLCGYSVISEIAALNPNLTVESETNRRYKNFRTAQGKLAARALELIRGRRYRAGGVMETERDVNADTTNKYESFTQTMKAREELYADALRLLKPYLTITETHEEETATVIIARRSTSVPIEIAW